MDDIEKNNFLKALIDKLHLAIFEHLSDYSNNRLFTEERLSVLASLCFVVRDSILYYADNYAEEEDLYKTFCKTLFEILEEEREARNND